MESSAAPPPSPIEYRPAPLLPRMGAFLLDMTLVSAIAFFFLSKIFIPQDHGEAWDEFYQMAQEYNANYQADPNNAAFPSINDLSPEIQEMLQFINSFYILTFWFYFFISENFMRGSSLGKKIFSLYVVNALKGTQLSALESCFRTMIKSFGFSGLLPLVVVNFSMPFFNAKRKAGHDYICKTAVAIDNRPPPEKKEAEDIAGY